MPSLLQSLEASGVGTLVRESLYGFPILVGLHLLGLALAVGSLLWFDLRLAGVVLRSVPVSRVYRQMMPWAAGGFVVAAGSGVLLFAGYATAALGNPYFRVKLVAMALAGLNAGYYHLVTERTGTAWDHLPQPPAAARRAGLLSIALWATVILCGRLMAYSMY